MSNIELSDLPILMIDLDTQETSIMFNNEHELYAAIVEFVRVKYRISTSMIQRQFSIGYNRTSRMMERMTQEGIIKFLGTEKGWRVLI